MKHLDLFSGIGGFALAARWAGWETLAFCEKEKYAKRVLGRHWPNVPVIDDIRNITEKIGCDIITGGFPCQPFSVAGKQKSTADDRHLWPEMLRVIALERPSWIVAENVPGIIGLALDQVLADLENAGYSSRALIIPACAVDAPHRRDRVWVMAHSSSPGTGGVAGEAGNAKRGTDRKHVPSLQQRDGEACTNRFDSASESKSLSHANSQSKPDGAIDEQESLENSASTRCNTRSELQLKDRATGDAYHSSKASESGQWLAEPAICRVVNGVPNRVDRLRGLGNAIVPQVAYQLFKFINEQNDNSDKR
jgi:DNA (cytosine-5)-methyltransferase 1